jgi:UDP-N-acetyl-D-mannosaminuronic acid dehydrogenase
MLYDIQSIMVPEGKSIFEVMKAINESASKFAMIVDNEERLVGIVTDGDIRRGFLNGHDAGEPVKNIMNRSPIVVKEGMSRETMLELVNEKYAQIPVLDDNGRVKGVITFKDKSVLLDAKSRQICMIGLGYVGLTLSVVLAELGFKVFGYDTDGNLIEKIKNGFVPFYEDNLEAYLHRYVGKNLIPISDLSGCKVDTYIVSVGTPVNPETKKPIIDNIEDAARYIAKFLKPDDLVVLRSTVPVGTTREVMLPILNDLSGLKAGIDYYLAYAPERTIEGRAISEIKELPQIIGGYDKKSTMLVNRLFREITPTIVDVGSLEGAEMVKILNNTFRDVKFGYANEMALVCKELGLDMVKLVQAANLGYVRDEIPVPSPGVGGACLTKDPYFLIHSCKDLKHQPRMVSHSRQINEFIPYHIVGEVHQQITQLKKKIDTLKIFIVGFAFKGEPETSDLRGSTTIDLLNHFRKKGIRDSSFFGYDPIVSQEEIAALGVKPVSIVEGFKDADVVLIMNNHKSYKKMDVFDLLNSARNDCIFVDGWYTFEPKDIITVNNVRYIGIGCRG